MSEYLPKNPKVRQGFAEWNVRRQSRGLGDTVAKVAHAVGITPERIERITGKPCGCGKRQEALNKLIPYATKPESRSGAEAPPTEAMQPRTD